LAMGGRTLNLTRGLREHAFFFLKEKQAGAGFPMGGGKKEEEKAIRFLSPLQKERGKLL